MRIISGVSKGNGNISAPFFITDATDGRAGKTIQELLFTPFKTVNKIDVG